MTITSTDNKWIKELRKLASSQGRSKSDLFAAEGEDLIAAAHAAGWTPVEVLVREGSDLQGEEVDPELLDSVSALGSGTRVIGLFRRQVGVIPEAGLVLHLAGIKDPGNVGTMIRSAHALGAGAVTLGPGSADPFSQKAVRASMGSIFAMPVVNGVSIGELPGVLVGLSAAGDTGPLPDGDLSLVVGSERQGLPPEVESACDLLWSIPMAEGAESLNASAAATVALYAANRIPT
jgi:TrmH family RNA methyltransferase